MGKANILIESKVILNEQLLTIRMVDISSSDVDSQKLRIDILDRNNTPIKEEEKVVELTEEYLIMWRQSREDLYNYLIQFRNSVPSEIHSQTRDIFVYPDWRPQVKMYWVGELIRKFFIAELLDEPLFADYIRNSVTIEYGEILSILGKYEKIGVVKREGNEPDPVIQAENWIRNLSGFLDTIEPIAFEEVAEGITVVREPASAVLRAGGARVATSDHCNEIMFDGNPCKRKSYSKDKCICHCDEPDKDVDQFSEVVNKMLSSEEASDFSGFVFPDDYEFPRDREFKGKLQFQKVHFKN